MTIKRESVQFYTYFSRNSNITTHLKAGNQIPIEKYLHPTVPKKWIGFISTYGRHLTQWQKHSSPNSNPPTASVPESINLLECVLKESVEHWKMVKLIKILFTLHLQEDGLPEKFSQHMILLLRMISGYKLMSF